ncbi:MAG: type I DNA topoisomerase, partial [Firmicutes bacterium]|nr:type I DNA topoisomerase [Bacillota bacterium]
YLGIKEDNCRIEFNEITAPAVKAAASAPHAIDMDRVDAQQARRILDRLVGYKISPILWKKIKKGLSAGRVQSVVVRLICDREQEINDFIPQEYWSLEAEFAVENGEFTAKLAKIGKKKAEIKSREEMDKVLDYLKDKSYTVTSVTNKEKRRNPQPPFTTSSMQQEAARRFGMITKKTMQKAQQIYEGIEIAGGVTGLITYMRTDSVRVSNEAQDEARSYVAGKYGSQFVPSKPNVYASKGKIQNAHEAIRPTSVERTPASVKAYLNPAQFKLYKLIWERFVASQMTAAVYDVTSAEVTAGDCLFTASGSVLKFPGYMQVYIEGKDSDDKEDEGMLPRLIEGENAALKKLNPAQHFTQPPARYNEATLVKALEELGIGRPSTYAPIIETICARGYVAREEKQFFPTELGKVVVEQLKEYFTDIMDIEFTADMEKSLDMVEEGEQNWRELMHDFYDPFAITLKQAEEEMQKIQLAPEYADELCEKCGKPMVYKMGAYGKFLACSGFPDCRNTKAIVKQTNVRCLACGGNIIERKSRSGRVFFGCDNYPECQYVSWDMPIEEKCPTCGTQLSKKTYRGGHSQIICPNKDCPENAGKKAAAAKKSASKSKTTSKKSTSKKSTSKKTTAKKSEKE